MREIWVPCVVVLADQLSKWVVARRMELGQSIEVLGSVVRFTYIHNPGAVFGIRVGGGAIHLAMAVAAMAVVGAMLCRLPKSERLPRLALSMVLGGAIGNLIDRLRVGEVVDFLDLGVGPVRWWIFNVADACVTTGAGLLLLSYALQRRSGTGSDGGATDAGRPR